MKKRNQKFQALQSLIRFFSLAAFLIPSLLVLTGAARSDDRARFEVGNLEGQAAANQGLLNYSLAFKFPAGIHGLKPGLALNYQQGGSNGIVGLAFGLSGMSAIHRCAATKEIDGFDGGVGFDDNDRYCLDGQRLIIVKGKDGSNGAEYRVRHNTNVKITSHGQTASGPSWWKVWTADGYVSEYGRENNSRETFGGEATSWRISSRQDRFGNALSYHYKNVEGFTYPDHIKYSGHKIEFVYEQRPDRAVNYHRGKAATLGLRLKTVKVFTASGLLREYRLSYDPYQVENPLRRYSRLNSVQLCGQNDKCLAPLKFKYKTNHLLASERPALPGESEPPPDEDENIILNNALFALDEFQNYVVGDLNKDGWNDICYYNEGLYCSLNQGEGKFKAAAKWTKALDSDKWKSHDTIYTLALLDINRDGFADYCLMDETGVFCGLNNQGKEFTDDRYWTKSVNRTEAPQFMDINRDKRLDVCAFKEDGVWCGLGDDSTFDALVRLKGENLVWAQRIRIKYSPDYDGTEYDYLPKAPKPRFLDVNADGYIDVCGFKEDENYHCALGKSDVSGDTPAFGTPVKWAEDFPMGDKKRKSYPNDPRYEKEYAPNWKETTPAYWKLKTEQFSRTFRHVDLNSDGLSDICYRRANNYVCRLNNGETFLPEQIWLELPPGSWTFDEEHAVHKQRIKEADYTIAMAEGSVSLSDRDGDGKVDFCAISGDQLKCAWNFDGRFNNYSPHMKVSVDLDKYEDNVELFQNNSDELEDGNTNGVKKLFGWGTDHYILRIYSAYGPFKQNPDLNGDQRPDDCYRGIRGLTCAFARHNPIALLESVEDSYGNKAVFEYGPMTDPAIYTPEKTEAPLIDANPTLLLVKALQTSNGIGGLNRVAFSYKGWAFHPEHGSFGFRVVEKRHETSQTTSITEYAQDKTLLGKVLKTSEKTGGKLVKQSEYQYRQSSGIHPQVKPVVLTYAANQTWELDGKPLEKRETIYSEHDAYGTPAKVEAIVSGGGEVFSKTTESSYLNNESNWIIAKPSKVSVTHQAPETSPVVRTTTFGYASNTGALVTETMEPGHPLSLTTFFIYDQKGNRIKTIVSDSQGNQRAGQIVPDSLGRPLERTNALGHKETTKYHPVCGSPQSATGPNGLTTRWEYDDFCRKKKVVAPDNQNVEWFYQWSDGADTGVDYQNLGLKTGDHSLYTVIRRSSSGAWSKTYYDSLGREVRSVKLGSGNKKVFQDKIYDDRGRVGAASPTYFQGEFPGDAASWLRRTYDDLGRPLKTVKPGKDNPGVINHSHRGLVVTEEGPGEYKRITTKNVDGKVVSIKDNDSLVAYKHDAVGNLVETNSNGYIVKMGYDLMGNRVWIEDPATGRIEHAYNAFKERIGQKDAKGQEIVLSYDVLGRLISREEPEGVSSWQYDSASDGVGKLAAVNGVRASRKYSYDKRGRVVQSVLTTDDRSFSTSYEYDNNGRLRKTVHPDGMETFRHYALDGSLKKVGVPKKNVWDYDYLQLEKALKKVGERIMELEKRANEYDARAKLYISKSHNFRHHADYYARESQNAATHAGELNGYADKLEYESEALRQKSLDFREKSNYYQRYMGNTYLKYKGTVNGHYYYENTECTKWKTKRKGKRRVSHCSRRNNFREYVPPWMTTIYGQAGPPARLNMGHMYGAWADRYQNDSDEKQAQADNSRSRAADYEARAAQHKQTSENCLNSAKRYAELAREQTDMLRIAAEELEEQKAAGESLREAIAQRSQDETSVYLWSAVSRDAAGRIKGELFGNGFLTRKEFDPHTGQLKRISTGMGADLIRDLNYAYDKRDNVLSRSDAISGVNETFVYDGYDRLTAWSYDDPSGDSLGRSWTYDMRGNMLTKTGAGVMSYDQANRLTSRVEDNGEEHEYSYDVNGNQLRGDGRDFVWTSFNKVRSVEYNGTQTSFSYDAGRRRVMKKSPGQKVYYVSPEYELVEEKNEEEQTVSKMRHHIFVNGQVVATYEKTTVEGAKLVDNVAYQHRDALNSVDAVTDNQGEVILKNRFAPFGERLDIDQPETELFKAEELRGYTGHEHVAEAGLINMNARLYDPVTARFLSPDTLIPDPDNWQSHNRYAYVYNNPMKYTDPDGHHPALFIAALFLYGYSQFSDNPDIRRYGSMTAVVLMSVSAPIPGSGPAVIMANGATVAFTVGYLSSGGDFRYALTQGFIGAVSAGATYGIGHETANLHWAAQAGMHGVAQGIIAEGRGGRFQDGFVAAVISKTGGHYSGKYLGEVGAGDEMEIAVRTGAAATLGGLAAQASGGNFNDGAYSAAVVHLYNEFGLNRMFYKALQEKRGREEGKHFEERLAKSAKFPSQNIKYYRNAKGWTERKWRETLFHNNCEGYAEIKFTHEDGREVIFNGATKKIISDPKYMGTYNYSNSLSGHFNDDMLPFFLGGNIRGSAGDYGLWDFICPFTNGSWRPKPSK